MRHMPWKNISTTSSRLLTSALVIVPTPRLVVQYNEIQENDDTVPSQKGEVIGVAKGEDLLTSLVSVMVQSGAD